MQLARKTANVKIDTFERNVKKKNTHTLMKATTATFAKWTVSRRVGSCVLR